MKVSSIQLGDAQLSRPASPAETVDRERRDTRKQSVTTDDLRKGKAHAEEVLDKIKSLTEEGTYSVRFELNKELNRMVVSVVDSESDKVIRQLPPEEVLGMIEFMRDFRGQLVDSAG